MTRQPPLPDDASRRADHLDAFLDRLASGDPGPPPDFDPSLAATARRIHALASDSVAADMRGAGKARRWEHLMHIPMKPAVVTPFPAGRTLPLTTPMPVLLRPAARPSRLRRWGSGSLGLVATLTLVLLVAASSLAVYLSAPQGGDEPTMLPAAFGATPVGTPTTTIPAYLGGDDIINMGDYPDLVVPLLSTCTVEPRSLEELSTILGVAIRSNSEATPRLRVESDATATRYPESEYQDISWLGDDATPATLGSALPSTVVAVTRTWQVFRSCEVSNEARRSATLVSDDYLIRYYFRNGPDVVGMAQLSNEPRTYDRLRKMSDVPDDRYLADFQLLADGRVRASIMVIGLDTDSLFRIQPNGYVIFISDGDTWLVDQVIQLLG